MTRRLKGLYPCNGCGIGVEVRSRGEIQFASCSPCRERTRLLSLSGVLGERANAVYEKHCRSHTDPVEMAVHLFEAAEKALGAVAAMTEAAQKHARGPAERARWIRTVVDWSKWATSVNDSVRARLAGQGHAIELVGAPPEPIALTEPKAGHLRVVGSTP